VDPVTVPVRAAGRGVVLLAGDGGLVPVSDAGTGGTTGTGLTTTGGELGDPFYDEGEIKNGLWDLEGEYGSAHAALCERENWDYAEVTGAWLAHAARRLAGWGIVWDPATACDRGGGAVVLPAGMSLPVAAARWGEVYAGFGEWISRVVRETRGGAGLAPPGGIRPETAPGARWVTWSIT
jgi:hypothetical protein